MQYDTMISDVSNNENKWLIQITISLNFPGNMQSQYCSLRKEGYHCDCTGQW